ncbi:unnamed protein product [Meloidogyne enterolobii]|uniref:Uncharacterized protein n=1 Tax=Meloidogyne enterolobii TaxID=390850 RepID=A0ACB1A829_MELEN
MLNIFILIISFISILSIELNREGARFCNFPKASRNNVTNTGFYVKGGEDVDFGMQRIRLNGNPGTCNSKIPKQWGSVITVADGGTVRNVILGVSLDGTAADINCMGSCTLKNIVDGGGALDGFQKIFDQSGPGKTIIKNFCAVNCAIGIASCGNCGRQYKRDMTIEDSRFKGPTLTIISANKQYQDKVTLRNITVYGNNNPATETTFVCSEYLGENVGDPWKYSYKPGQAGTGSSCNYPASAVKVIN